MSSGSGAGPEGFGRTADCAILSEQALEQSVRQLEQLLRHAREARLRRKDSAVSAEPSAPGVIDRDMLRARALEIYLARRQREQLFGAHMFGEPAWDLLLALYMFDEIAARFTIKRLTGHVRAPPTTVLRWLNYLEEERLIVRKPLATDRRICLVQMSDRGRSLLDTYLSEDMSRRGDDSSDGLPPSRGGACL